MASRAGQRQGPRGLRRPDHRRPLRPRHHLRRRRHHDRAHQRPRHGVAAAEPVPGAAADRALARRRHAGRMARRAAGRRAGAGAPAAARVGNGVRAAAAARDGHQPGDRRRDRRRRGGRTHRRRRRCADPRQLRPPGHPALPGEPGTRMADEGRWPVHAAPDPARRRRDAAGLRARPVAGEPLFPLRQRDAGTAGAHAGALHADRLRPRDGAGGRRQGHATPPTTAAPPKPNAWSAWCATSPTPTPRVASSRS